MDVFDIEVNEKDPKKLIEVIKAIAPTFGGINLEDIKAPECFEVEQTLKKELDIPVFHRQRAVHRNDSTWFNRSGLLMSSSYRIDNNPLYGNNYYLNDYISNNILLPLESIPKPSDLEKHWTQNGIYNGMVNIELQLRSLANQIDCIKNTMLKDRLIYLIPKLEEVKLHKNIIIEMAKLYLLLAAKFLFMIKMMNHKLNLFIITRRYVAKQLTFIIFHGLNSAMTGEMSVNGFTRMTRKFFWDSAKEI